MDTTQATGTYHGELESWILGFGYPSKVLQMETLPQRILLVQTSTLAKANLEKEKGSFLALGRTLGLL